MAPQVIVGMFADSVVRFTGEVFWVYVHGDVPQVGQMV